MPPHRQLGLLWGGVALALLALAPLAPRLAAGLPPCPIHSLTGYPCPTCGTTRAALALARFDLGAAVAVNPLAAAGWIGLIGGGLVALALALLRRAPLALPRPPLLVLRLGVGIALIANWLYLVWRGT